MEEDLKLKYNELLARFKKGQELLEKEPENEKYQTTLKQIGEEMENVLQGIGEFTEEEMQNGFKIEAPKEEKAVIVKPTKQETSIVETYSNNWKLAEKLATSSLLPDEFQGHPENVLIALSMAQKMGLDPFTVCQNLHLVKGRLSWSGSFCKTLIEKTGQYKDLDLIYVGKEGTDERGCYLEATRIRDGKRIKGNTVTVALAKAEKWWSKKDKYGNETSKWPNMTEQMLGYRAMAFFARLYTPEALNGVLTEGESEDIVVVKEQPQDIL